MPLVEDGATAYFTKLPAKSIVKAIRDHGIPSNITYSAGTFVCNEIMYMLLYMIEREFNDIRGGFIHVPFDTAQVIEKPDGTPSMPITTIAEGLEYAISAIINNERDIDVAAGTTH